MFSKSQTFFLSLSVLVCLFKTRVRIIVCRKLGTLFLELWYIVLHFYLEWCCYSYFVNQFTKVIYWKFDNFSSTCFFKTNWSTRMSTTHLQVIWLKTIVNRWFSEEIDTNQSKSHRFLFILPLWEYFACFSSDCFWWEFFSFHLFFLIEWNSSLVHLFLPRVAGILSVAQFSSLPHFLRLILKGRVCPPLCRRRRPTILASLRRLVGSLLVSNYVKRTRSRSLSLDERMREWENDEYAPGNAGVSDISLSQSRGCGCDVWLFASVCVRDFIYWHLLLHPPWVQALASIYLSQR